MRKLLVCLASLLPGCAALGPVAAVGGASVAAIGRSPIDLVASYATGRDCSIVRLDRRESYCAPAEAPPSAEPFCTMSLGRADCWTVPPVAMPPYQPHGDGARALTAAQESNRTRFGPGLSLPQPVPAPPPTIVPVVVGPPPVAPPVAMDPIPDPPVPVAPRGTGAAAPRQAEPAPAARPAEAEQGAPAADLPPAPAFTRATGPLRTTDAGIPGAAGRARIGGA